MVVRAVNGPRPVSYRSVVPRRGQCTNLVVAICVSAAHVARSSPRTEPVLMMLGQAAGAIARLARRRGVAVQDLPYARTLAPAPAAGGLELAAPG
jgi:hypothetical protein